MTNAKFIFSEIADVAKIFAIITSMIAIFFVAIPLAYVYGSTLGFVESWRGLYDILWLIVPIAIFAIIWLWFVSTFESRLVK